MFLNTSACRKILLIKLSGSSRQKVFFSIYWRNAYVWTHVYQEVAIFLKTFLKIFVMPVNEEVGKIDLSISDITGCRFFSAIFTEISKFWCEVFTIIMECLRV